LFRANPDFVGADGFEILLSDGKTEVESKNELKAIHSYLKANRALVDIRWCLRMHTVDEVRTRGILKNMKLFPPSFVRIDPHLETPRADVEKMKAQVALIQEFVPYPIKISGNVNAAMIKELQDIRGVKRFDVSMKQAEAIAHELKLTARALLPESTTPTKKGPAVKQVGTAGRIRI